ncbi:MAG: TRAP transporter large permease subunit [Pseudomonadota bacterium]
MELLFLAVLILVMALALASGFPVAFALPGAAITTIGLAAASGALFAGDASAYFAQGGPIDWLTAGVTNFRGVYWEVERDTLIAIPLFVFMGIMLQRSKIAEDLLVTMAQLFGPIPGGLGISVVFVGALLAATTGILGATVVAMGLISLPAMLRNNYSQSLATGTIAASGTLGQIIPPSIVLIILADQLASAVDQAGTARKNLYKDATGNISMPSEFGVVSTSAGDMFLGALVPGLILVGLYMAYILTLAIIRPKSAPSVPFEGRMDARFWLRVVIILVPPLALIFAVLGSIILGIATVNQAGAIGAAGAMIMAGYRLKEGERGAFIPAIIAIASLVAIFFITQTFDINVRRIETADDQLGVTLAAIAVASFLFALAWSGWRAFRIDETLKGVMIDTAKTTSLVFIILLGAAMLTAAFRAFGGEELVREFLTNLSGGFWAQFIIVMAVIFLLGFFLDFIEIAVVVVPIVAPILLMDPSANITAVWLGVMIGLNIQTSFLTPPFGFALFYLRGVAPAAVTTLNMYKGVVPFIALQIAALGIVGSFPPLVNYLPTRLSLLSETAPPPQNPRLQHCIEEYVLSQYETNGDALRQAITTAKTLDKSDLPKAAARDLDAAIKKAEESFERVSDIRSADQAIASAAPAYRPLHTIVRAIEADIARHKSEIQVLRTRLQRSRTASDEVKAAIEADISAEEATIAALQETIPEEWEGARAEFAKLQKTEQTASRQYRRAVDAAYEPITELIATLEATDELAALRGQIEALGPEIGSVENGALADRMQAVMRAVGAVEGARSIRSAISSARRAVRARSPDLAKAVTDLTKALDLHEAELAWRRAAAPKLLEPLKAYEAQIRTTIGLRKLRRLPRDQALYVAACNSQHRDISLSF